MNYRGLNEILLPSTLYILNDIKILFSKLKELPIKQTMLVTFGDGHEYEIRRIK